MYFWLILGLAILVFGGEFLVRGAVILAKRFHVSSLVIGMTVISFGTSAPELIVSLNAALGGHPEIAIGNVVGSSIANISLVLGITVLIFPIAVDRNSKIIDWPIMMFASLLFFVFAYDNIIETYEGIILFAILCTFTYLLVRNSRKKTKKVLDEIAIDPDDAKISEQSPLKAIGYLTFGLISLYFGASWLLEGAVQIAKDLGMEERIIGVTIVAFGTSVPELITSAIAAYRKETDIAIGNLIGSNIFNILGVIGLTAIIKPIEVAKETISTDMWWLLGIALALLPIMIIGKKVGRFKGALLIGTYVMYISMLITTVN